MNILLFLKRMKTIWCSGDGSVIKSIYYNFKYLPARQAVMLPIMAARMATITGDGKIMIDGGQETVKPLSVYIGAGCLKWMDKKSSPTRIFVEGIIRLKGNAFIGSGTSMEIGENAELTIGRGLNITGLSKIICARSIEFGSDVLISWDTLVMDTDAHRVVDQNGKSNEMEKSIVIGDHVWICSRATILKGSTVADDNIIACGSVVSGSFPESHTIIAGNKGQVIRRHVNWLIH